ncbi:MAG: repeat containing protein [Herbinix sp.]|nr:repeat containing protein [Herbinix sp.]
MGLDNEWLNEHPFLYDYPGSYLILNGQNFETENVMSAADEPAYTGAFTCFGAINRPYEVQRSFLKASGSIMRVNTDGSDLERIAWGLRNPVQINFDQYNRMFVTNQGYDSRGSRPIANAPDELVIVTEGGWYGWPDFSAGMPITLSRFQPEGKTQPEFLITNHPSEPPEPFATFPPYSSVSGFAFNLNPNFGPFGDAYVAEFGSLGFKFTGGRPFLGIGHRVSKVNMVDGEVSTFAINKSSLPVYATNEGGFGRPIDIKFGPDEAMYILDFGVSKLEDPSFFFPYTGAIWKVTKS